MKISVITVGKLKEKFWVDAEKEYLKRLSGYSKINIIEVDENGINKAINKLKNPYTIGLYIKAKQYDSEDLASHIDNLKLQGKSHVAFVIGGSTGIPNDVKTDEQISFGKITLPHNLARVVLLEQIYRCFKISAGEKYHK